MKLNPKKLAAVAGIALLSVAGVNRARSEWVVHNLTQLQGQRDDSSPRIPQDPATTTRWRQFDAIWQARTKRKITSQVVPFLTDPFPYLRIRAARALGELEDPKAQAPLQAILGRMKTEDNGYQVGGIPRLTLQLALGRIDSHHLNGRTKVVAMVKQVGLDWPDLVRLSRKVNSLSRLDRTRTSGNEIIEEVVGLLYTMGKRGEDVRSLAAQLSLIPAQKVIIQGAPLPVDKEARLILDSFSRFDVFVDSEVLVAHLLDLKPRASNVVVERLQDVRRHPENYRKTSVESLGLLFRTAIQLDDPRVLPLLKKFEADPKPWPDLRREAQIAEQFLQTRAAFSSTHSQLPLIPRE